MKLSPKFSKSKHGIELKSKGTYGLTSRYNKRRKTERQKHEIIKKRAEINEKGEKCNRENQQRQTLFL